MNLPILAIISSVMLFIPSAEKLMGDLNDLERDARALELYLQDQKDYEEYCPHLDWTQPPLSKYKETLRSHLPSGCK